jgi:hypothetical protein
MNEKAHKNYDLQAKKDWPEHPGDWATKSYATVVHLPDDDTGEPVPRAAWVYWNGTDSGVPYSMHSEVTLSSDKFEYTSSSAGRVGHPRPISHNRATPAVELSPW